MPLKPNAMHAWLCRAAAMLLVLPLLLEGTQVLAEADHRQADLSTLVVVGDSVAAGYQNSSLMATQQVHGFASLIAEQAGVELPLPLISEPGFPPHLALVSLGPPPVVAPVMEAPGGRINPDVVVQNLSVPGAFVHDALVANPTGSPIPGYPYVALQDLVLTSRGIHMSQVEWAEALHPTTVILCLGNNDLLWSAILADPAWMTPEADFETDYAEVVDRLAATGATMVICNLPDVTVTPYLTPAEAVAAMVNYPLDAIGPLLGIGPGDYVTPSSFELIGGILAGQIPGPLPDAVVLTADEVAQIRERTAEWNGFIADQAAAHGAAVVDIHGLLNFASRYGIVVDGRRITTQFLGGVFTLDGIHPTNTGHAVIANEVIHVLNSRFRAHIRRVSVGDVLATDPLVFEQRGQAASLNSLTRDAIESIRGEEASQ
jgi:lysophospholipase L1-like esterase